MIEVYKKILDYKSEYHPTIIVVVKDVSIKMDFSFMNPLREPYFHDLYNKYIFESRKSSSYYDKLCSLDNVQHVSVHGYYFNAVKYNRLLAIKQKIDEYGFSCVKENKDTYYSGYGFSNPSLEYSKIYKDIQKRKPDKLNQLIEFCNKNNFYCKVYSSFPTNEIRFSVFEKEKQQ